METKALNGSSLGQCRQKGPYQETQARANTALLYQAHTMAPSFSSGWDVWVSLLETWITNGKDPPGTASLWPSNSTAGKKDSPPPQPCCAQPWLCCRSGLQLVPSSLGPQPVWLVSLQVWEGMEEGLRIGGKRNSPPSEPRLLPQLTGKVRPEVFPDLDPDGL